MLEEIADGGDAPAVRDVKEAAAPGKSETELEKFLREADEDYALELAAPPNPAYRTENWLAKGKGMLGLVAPHVRG